VELERGIGTITSKVLTQRLRQMERDGLVLRTYYPEVPPRVEYEISDLGRSLSPLFAVLADWSQAFRGRRLKRWQRRHNSTHAKIRCLGEPAMATLKGRRLLWKLRCSTNRITAIVQAVLVLPHASA
jgi:DNA-binding PadR family transcriptional regulator